MLTLVNPEEINCLCSNESKNYFYAGGKGFISLCDFATLKEFSRLKVPIQDNIVKIVADKHRLSALDQNGNLCLWCNEQRAEPIFSLKKEKVYDMCMLSATVLAANINGSAIHAYDLLLHPKRQSVFKLNFTDKIIAISALSQNKFELAKKHELVTYDIRMNRQEEYVPLEAHCRCMATVSETKVAVGRSDSKVKGVTLNGEKPTVYMPQTGTNRHI